MMMMGWVCSAETHRWEYREIKLPAPHPTDGLDDILRLATALHAEEHIAEVKRVACDHRKGEDEDAAQHRVHATMWSRETPAVREAYSVRAVGLLAWMGKR